VSFSDIALFIKPLSARMFLLDEFIYLMM
jgi:hypothetical protein